MADRVSNYIKAHNFAAFNYYTSFAKTQETILRGSVYRKTKGKGREWQFLRVCQATKTRIKPELQNSNPKQSQNTILLVILSTFLLL